MRLDGETRLIPILGDPIAQVKSPTFLTRRLADRGVNAIVPPAHVTPEDLVEVVRTLRRIGNLDGMILTIPHKIRAVALCDALSERAGFVGSVNVIRKRADGALFGDNCDGQGYVAGIRREGGEPRGKRVLLVGAGGAGCAIAFEMLDQGAAELAIHDADAARMDALIDRLAARFPGKVRRGDADPTGFDIVANATPMGMRETDPTPVRVDRLAPDQFVAECITQPEVSPLIAAARARGCRTMLGLGMFDGVADRMVEFFAAPA